MDTGDSPLSCENLGPWERDVGNVKRKGEREKERKEEKGIFRVFATFLNQMVNIKLNKKFGW